MIKPATQKQINLALKLGIPNPERNPRHILKTLIDQAIERQKEDRHQAYERIAEEINHRADLLHYTGDMQQVGQVYQGLCPFHTERTGSFTVYPDSNSWYCFGACQEGGDVISFIQKQHNLDFIEAIKGLASDCGIPLPDTNGSQAQVVPLAPPPPPPKPPRKPARQKEYKWQEQWWQQKAQQEVADATERLLSYANGYADEARDYVYNARHFSTEAIQAFGLGQLMSCRWNGRAKQSVPIGNAITIPWRGPNGTIKAVQHRLIKNKQRFNQKAGGERTLFGTHLLQPSKDRILIVYEGEFNAISSWQIVQEEGMPICSISFGPEDNAARVAPLIEQLSTMYCATVVWADKMEIAQTIKANLHLQSYDAQDANDLLKIGNLQGILEKCLTHFGFSQE